MKVSLRRTVRHLLSLLVFYPGFLRLHLYLRSKLSSLPDFTILMYHRVLDIEYKKKDNLQPGMVTLRNTFDKHMKFLKKRYNVISLDLLTDSLKNKNSLPPRSVVITFDDGWKDNYLFAFPILKRYELPATIFLSTGYINTSKMFWFHVVNLILQRRLLTAETMTDILDSVKEIRPEARALIVRSLSFADWFIESLKKIDPETQERIIREMIKKSEIREGEIDGRRWMLGWDEIKEMSKSQISFGSHARSHRILTYLNSTEIEEELAESKNAIEEKTKMPISSFAYPNGDFNPQIKKLVQEAGYLCACTVGKKSNRKDEIDLFTLPRIGVHEGISLGITGKFSKAIFGCQIAGLFIRRRKWQERNAGDK